MKAKSALGILILSFAAVAGILSCPIQQKEKPVILKTSALNPGLKCSENAARLKQDCRLNAFELCITEDKTAPDFAGLTPHSHSRQERMELMPATIANLIDFSLSKCESKSCVIIETRETIYLAFPHPMPQRTIAAFIRNGILKV